MRVPLIFCALVLPVAVSAEVQVYSCAFTQQCHEGGDCDDIAINYVFRLDTDTHEGHMQTTGFEADGYVAASGDSAHFLFVNDAGSETISFDRQGGVAYSGHLAGGGDFYYYSLTGSCKVGPTQ